MNTIFKEQKANKNWVHRKLSRGDKIKQVSISLASAFVNMKVFAKDAELEFLGINQRKAKSVIDTLPDRKSVV